MIATIINLDVTDIAVSIIALVCLLAFVYELGRRGRGTREVPMEINVRLDGVRVDSGRDGWHVQGSEETDSFAEGTAPQNRAPNENISSLRRGYKRETILGILTSAIVIAAIALAIDGPDTETAQPQGQGVGTIDSITRHPTSIITTTGVWQWQTLQAELKPGWMRVSKERTVLSLYRSDIANTDWSGTIQTLKPPYDTILLQRRDGTVWHGYKVTAPPVLSDEIWEIPVQTNPDSPNGDEPVRGTSVRVSFQIFH